MIPAKPQIAALFPKGKRGNVSRAAAGLPERVKSWEALIALGPASSSISSFHFSAGLEETRALLLSCASAEIDPGTTVGIGGYNQGGETKTTHVLMD